MTDSTPSVLRESTSYKPFGYPWAMELAEQHEKMHWIHTEAPLDKDVKDWQMKLSDDEISFITQVLKLFTQSDVQVGSNYTTFLLPVFKNNEIQNMLMSFAAREGIHQRAYASLIETLNLPDSEFTAFLEYKEMSDKIDFWKACDTSTQTGKAQALCKNIFAEGVSLFGSFIMLLNFQRRGLMQGMCEINTWSILDEQFHCSGLVRLFRVYMDEHPRIATDEFKKSIYDMARTTYKLEAKFIDLAFDSFKIEGLDKEAVKQYIQYLIDRRLTTMGFKTEYGVTNPMTWFDELVGLPALENFFETTVTSYSKGGMDGKWEDAWD